MDETTQQPAELKHEMSENVDLSSDIADAPPADAPESQPSPGTRVFTALRKARTA